MIITLYTDGAALGNPGPGGYGAVLIAGKHRKELAQGYRLTTNNRMELLAVIVGLEALKNPESEVHIYTDSQYVMNGFTKNWIAGWIKRNWKSVKNPDLWQRLITAHKPHRVTFHWVKGHSGIPENERCDQLATAAARENPNLVDEYYEALAAEDSPSLFTT